MKNSINSVIDKNTAYFKAIFYFVLLTVFILSIIPDTEKLPEITRLSDKLNHVAAFFTLALLIDFAYPFHSLLWKFNFLFWYGLFIECIQYFLPYREFSLLDLGADLFGLSMYFLMMKVRKAILSTNKK